MKIGYVCTNYNNSSYTIKAVETLLFNTNHTYEVVVVDNHSRMEEQALLKPLGERFLNVEIICSNYNVGYFPGLNIGIKALRARHRDIEWMVIGNNDLEFPVDFSDRLAVASAALMSYPVVSPDVVTVEGQHQNPHVISNISHVREMFYDLYYSNYYAGKIILKFARLLPRISERTDEEQWRVPRSIYQGHGSCYLLGPLFFENFKELWAPTFLMSEEFFLSKQLSDAGFKIFYEPAIQIIHRWHGSLEKLPTRQRWDIARDAHRQYRKYVKWI
jgi:GT2 family glycosyltransferase